MAMAYKVTVEPVLLLSMIATFMLLPALQDLIYSEYCRNHFSEDVCENIYKPENEESLATVETGSSHWILGSTIMLAVPSIICAQFLGSWSDTYGRKVPLLIPPIGGILSSLVYILMSTYMDTFPVSYVLLASFLSGMCGGFTSSILTCMSYITQASNLGSRTVRVGVLESMIYFGGAIGPLLTGLIHNHLGRAEVFTTLLAIYAAIFIYVLLFIKNIPPRYPPEGSWWQNFWSCKHFSSSVLAVVRRRQENRRTYILLLLLSATIIMFCSAGEMNTAYIFVKDEPIEWALKDFVKFMSLKLGLSGLALTFFLPLLRRYSDSVFLFFGTISKMVSLILFGVAKDPILLYVSAVSSILSSWCLPSVRSSMSKLAEPGEQGKLFASIALMESACMLIASALFNSIYPVTRQFFSGFVFIIAGVLCLIPLISSCYLYKSLKKFTFYDAIEEPVDSDVQRVDSPPETSSVECQGPPDSEAVEN